jgi:hypothetical protein
MVTLVVELFVFDEVALAFVFAAVLPLSEELVDVPVVVLDEPLWVEVVVFEPSAFDTTLVFVAELVFVESLRLPRYQSKAKTAISTATVISIGMR